MDPVLHGFTAANPAVAPRASMSAPETIYIPDFSNPFFDPSSTVVIDPPSDFQLAKRRVALFDGLRGGTLIRDPLIEADPRVGEAYDQLLQAKAHLDESITRTHPHLRAQMPSTLKVLINDVGSIGNAIAVPEGSVDSSSPHLAVGPLDSSRLEFDRNWKPDAIMSSIEAASAGIHKSPAVLMHELGHVEQHEAWKGWDELGITKEVLRAKAESDPRSFEMLVPERLAVGESLADIRAATYVQDWKIATDSGKVFRDNGAPIGTKVRELREVLQADIVPWEKIIELANVHRVGLVALRDMMRASWLDSEIIPVHDISQLLTHAARKMQPTLGWEGLEGLVHETVLQLREADNILFDMDDAARAMRAAGTKLWGAESRNALAVVQGLARVGFKA